MNKVLKLAYILIFFIGLLKSNASQSDEKISIGLIGGLNLTPYSYYLYKYDLIDYSRPCLGYIGGLFFKLSPFRKDNIYLSLELSGKRIGECLGETNVYDKKGNITNSFKRYSYKDYVELPILFKYQFISKKSLSTNIFLGPSIAFLIRAKNVNFKEMSIVMKGEKMPYYIGSEGDSYEVTEEKKRIDFGIVIGIGLDIKLKRVLLLFDGRYNLGLINTLKNNKPSKNRVISILIGLGYYI